MSALPTLHPFTRLSAELQTYIWEYALEPHQIRFKSFTSQRDNLQYDPHDFPQLSIHSYGPNSTPCKLPAALLVHRKPRDFILARYPFWTCKGMKIGANFKLDIIHIVYDIGFVFFDANDTILRFWIHSEDLSKEEVTQIRVLEVDRPERIPSFCMTCFYLEIVQRLEDVKLTDMRVCAEVASGPGGVKTIV